MFCGGKLRGIYNGSFESGSPQFYTEIDDEAAEWIREQTEEGGCSYVWLWLDGKVNQ